MAYAGHSSIGCPVYPSASTLGSALLEQSNYAPSGFHPSLLCCILNYATRSFLNNRRIFRLEDISYSSSCGRISLTLHDRDSHLFSVQVLDSTGTSEAEYDVFRDVVLPLGRSPTFASRSGG